MQKTLSVINLSAIRKNALKIKSLIGKSQFFAVVKADAYGHGAEEVSRCIEDLVDGFCVAIIDEGVSLRVAGITKPVLVFTPPFEVADVARAKAYSLTLTVNSVHTARLVDGAECHIKVNTGMNRLGCNPDGLAEVLKVLPAESIGGVYSHLFAPPDDKASKTQLALFQRAARLVKTFKPTACAHLSASGGIVRGGEYLCDGVRAGIMLYGYPPVGFNIQGLTPALKVYARRIQTTRFIGGGVGYNFADKNYKNLSAYRCGYAEGFLRGVPLGEKTLCMDTFISTKNDDLIAVMEDAQEYAERCKTISYEVLTAVTHRSERVYER